MTTDDPYNKWRALAEEAQRDAVNHWHRLRDLPIGDEPRPGPESCELCQVFRKGQGDHACTECPVALVSGREGCGGTPYKKAQIEYHEAEDFPRNRDARDAWVAAATDEIEFLETVLAGVLDGTVRP